MKSSCDNSKQTSPWNFMKLIRNIWNFEMMFFTCDLVDFEWVHHSHLSVILVPPHHTPIPDFPAQIPHRTITHNVHTAQLMMNLGMVCPSACRKQITPQTSQLVRIAFTGCVYLVTTHAQLNIMDSELAFSKITFHWSLQEMCCVAVATSLFLAASQKLLQVII